MLVSVVLNAEPVRPEIVCASQCLGWAFWDSLRGGVGLRENTGCQVRDKMLMFGRPRCAGEGEMNLMKYFAGWNADARRKIGRNGCPSV